MKLCFGVLMMVAFFPVRAQSGTDLSPGYYVVVASYRTGQENYAKAYTAKLTADGKHPSYGFDPGRKFFHVYLDKYAEFNESIRQMLAARKEGFTTAWVRIIVGTGTLSSSAGNLPAAETSVASKPKASAAPVVVKPAEPVAAPTEPLSPVEANPAPADVVKAALPPAEAVAPTIANDPVLHPKMLTGNTVLMTLYNPTNNEPVDGDVEIVDPDRTRLLTRVKSGTETTLPDPKNNTGKLLLKASAFGYRPIEHALNYKATDKDSVPEFMDVENEHYRLRFGMVRLHRGDIAVLYNVYFYNDAAVMIPDSKYELNKLLELMNSNKNYRIRLHGHTNGNGHGKIISLGPSRNFFSLNADVKQGIGSAKELSRQRAETIREWLISQQVAPDRIEVQAHGGNRMLHDKNSANAKRNVRVEVEMLSE